MSRWVAGPSDAALRAAFAPVDAGLAVAADAILYVRPGGSDSADGLSWKTAKQTLAAAITALSSGGVIEIAGAHTIASALPQPANNTLIRGRGPAARLSWTGAGTMLTITAGRQISFRNIRVTATAAGQTLFTLSNSFRCSWDNVLIDGQHTSGTTYRGQIGFQFRGNSGDNRIVNCDLNNLGEAVQTDTIMNYMIGCVVGSCWTGVHVDAGSFTGGMAIDNCTFQGTSIGAANVRAHVLIDVAANQTWITNSWFEGCTTAVQAGSNSGTPGGPYGMVIQNCRLAATTKCLDIQAGRQFRLDNVRFATDSAASPTELTIDATNAPDGFASNIVSAATFDILRSAFPSNWTYLPRSTSDVQMSGPNMHIGSGLGAGTASYYQAGGGRFRVGYDGARTILSSAGSDRDTALVSGVNNRQAVLASDGVLYVGSKTQGTLDAGGAVIGVRIQDAVTLPTTNPSTGGVLYVDNGALKYRGKGGTVTTIASS